jgi:hypothetical protein
MRSLLSTVHGAEIASCFEQWAIKGVFLYLHKRKWIEEGRAEGRKEGTSMRPAGGLQTNRTFFCLTGTIRLFCDGFAPPCFKRIPSPPRQEKGDFALGTKAERKNLKIYSRRCRDGLCVALIIIDYVCVAYQMRCALFSTTHCALM